MYIIYCIIHIFLYRKKLIYKRTCGNKNGKNHIIIILIKHNLNDSHMLIQWIPFNVDTSGPTKLICPN